jgi:hypothetical protein
MYKIRISCAGLSRKFTVERNEVYSLLNDLVFSKIEDSEVPNARLKKETKRIESVKDIKGKKNQLLYYLVSFKEGVFLILSADKRIDPILAFDTENKFEIGENQLSDGILDWMDGTEKLLEVVS